MSSPQLHNFGKNMDSLIEILEKDINSKQPHSYSIPTSSYFRPISPNTRSTSLPISSPRYSSTSVNSSIHSSVSPYTLMPMPGNSIPVMLNKRNNQRINNYINNETNRLVRNIKFNIKEDYDELKEFYNKLIQIPKKNRTSEIENNIMKIIENGKN